MDTKHILNGNLGSNLMSNLLKGFFLVLVLFVVDVTAGRSEQVTDSAVLAKSTIKSNYKKDILKRIRNSLSKESKKNAIFLQNVQSLKRGDINSSDAEEWTVVAGNEKMVFFIVNESPKGVYYTVIPKQKRFAKEKEIWDAVKNEKNEKSRKEWRDVLFYINEIETLENTPLQNSVATETGASTQPPSKGPTQTGNDNGTFSSEEKN